MALQSSGPIKFSEIQTEFGGTNPISMSEYYAGGVYVPAGTTGINGAVPTSDINSLSKYYGTQAVLPTLITGATGTLYTANLTLANQYVETNGSEFIVAPTTTTNVYKSTDAITWTQYTTSGMTPISESFLRYDSQLGAYISINTSSASNMIVHSSPDGITWTLKATVSFASVPPNQYWFGNLVYGDLGGTYKYVSLIVGNTAQSGVDSIATSTDLITWTRINDPYTGTSQRCVYVPNMGVSQGGTGLLIRLKNSSPTGPAYTSLNGTTWTSRDILDSVTGTPVTVFGSGAQAISCATDGSVFCAITSTGRPVVSTDGINFTIYPAITNIHTTTQNARMTYGNGYFVLTANTSQASPNNVGVWTSTDGVNWNRTSITTTMAPLISAATRVLFDGTYFVWINSTSTYKVLA